MDSLVKEWTLFLDGCLENRIHADLFNAAATQLHGKSPLPGRKLAALLLRPHSAAATSLDPRVIIYVECLLALKKIDASDVLSAAFQYSRDHPTRTAEEDVALKEESSTWHNPPELEEIIFHRLHKAFSTGERPSTNAEAVRTLIVVTGWMASMVTSHTSDSMMQAMAGIQQHPQQQSLNVREALGMLLVGLIENIRILELLTKDELKGKCVRFSAWTHHMSLDPGHAWVLKLHAHVLTYQSDVRKNFIQSLSTFIPFLSQTSLQIANRLELSQKEHDFHDKTLATANGDASENAGLEVAALQLENVLDLPLLNTRAGLYIFLNSLVSLTIAKSYDHSNLVSLLRVHLQMTIPL